MDTVATPTGWGWQGPHSGLAWGVHMDTFTRASRPQMTPPCASQ